MKILFHNFYNSLNKNNFLFNEINTSIGDNLLAPFHQLSRLAHSKNIIVGTSDVIRLDEASALVFLDYPDLSNPIVKSMLSAKVPKYLIVFESPLVRQIPARDKLLEVFERIFTYDDSMIDHERILKINYSFDFKGPITSPQKTAKKLLTLIAGNKNISLHGELYSKRLEAIHWFEKNAPQDFDLYGVGWDLFDFGREMPWRVLNRFYYLRKLLARKLKTYRGAVLRKNHVLNKYQFAICYENVANVPGYITEKIFDCFLAGCVPIYWGANNVSSHIPKNCYIDKTEFTSYDDLYRHLKEMEHSVYDQYIANIDHFISGEKGAAFSSARFATTIIDPIVLDLNNVKYS